MKGAQLDDTEKEALKDLVRQAWRAGRVVERKDVPGDEMSAIHIYLAGFGITAADRFALIEDLIDEH